MNLQLFAPAPSPDKILLGEGAFYLNYDPADSSDPLKNILVGISESGGTFNREVSYRETNYMGKMGKTKGLNRKETANSSLTINVLETVDSANLVKMYAGLEVDNTPTEYDIIKAKEQIKDEDYLDNVAYVGETQDGRPVVVVVLNALGDGNMEWAFEDKSDVIPEVQFSGNYDPADPKGEPFEIHYPKA